MAFVYTLSYNPLANNFSHDQLQLFIEKNREIESWYLPFVGTYMLKSGQTVGDFAVSFRRFFGDSTFVLTYGIPKLMSGSLPQSIWDWINIGNPPAIAGKQ